MKSEYEDFDSYNKDIAAVIEAKEYNRILEKQKKDLDQKLKGSESKIIKFLPTNIWFKIPVNGIDYALAVHSSNWGGTNYDVIIKKWNEDRKPLQHIYH